MQKFWYLISILISVSPLLGQFTSSNLPIILIDTRNGVEITKTEMDAWMKAVDNPGQRNDVSGPYNEYEGLISIKGRGESSWALFDKKNYTIETRLATRENNNVPLLGLPSENDWVLHGPFADKTLIKNALVYDIGRSLRAYAPRTRFCELVLNGDYRGVYLLVERIKRDKNRVDIARLNPDEVSGDDLTGGYIIRIDRQQDEFWPPLVDFGFGLSYYNYFYPNPEGMPQEQKDYIRNYIEAFEVALLNRRFDEGPTGYRHYVNLPSFIDHFIINELTKNLDAYRLSTYIHKDKDSKGGKLTMGPLWDYNLSCGGVNIGFGDWASRAENWVHEDLPEGVPFWWGTLLQDRYYTSCFKKRWEDLRINRINEEQFDIIIDAYVEILDEAKDRNFSKFPLAEPVWGNNHFGFTYEQEIDTLKGFLKKRIEWMDSAIRSLPGGDECKECFNCGTVSSEDPLGNDIRIRLYPNPAGNQITLHLDLSSSAEIRFEIFQPSGIRMKVMSFKSGSGPHQLALDLSDLDYSGALIYRVSSAEGILGSGKLIKK